MTELSGPWWRRNALALAAAAVAFGTAVVLVVPGGGTSDDSRADRTSKELQYDGTRAAPGSADLAPGAGTTVGGSTGGSVGTGTASGTASGVVGDDETRVVKTGTISLVVDEGKVSATVTRVQAIVAAARGFVADSTSEELGEHPVASITVRVPVQAFESVVAQVRGIGAKVVSAQTSGRDVTAAYADTRAQIQSLQAARARYLAILAGARSIGETLTVQQRVDDVQGRIDRLEGQRRVLADSSDLATLTVSVAEQTDQVLLTKEKSGWDKAWDDATDGFTGGLQGMLARSGRALLALLVAAALYPLARLLLRRVRRRLDNAADGGPAPIA